MVSLRDPINKTICPFLMYEAPRQVKWNEKPDGIKFNKINMTIRNRLFINKVTRFFAKTDLLLWKTDGTDTFIKGQQGAERT